MRLRTFFARALVVFAAAVPLYGAGESRQHAESLVRKIAIISQPAPAAGAAGPRRTAVTQDELNSWFLYRGPQYLPAGVTNANVTIIGNGTMKGAALIDLETLGKKRSTGGVLDFWSLLGGRVPVSVTGTLTTKDGRGRFDMQSAEMAGVPVPKALLQEIVTMYAGTPDHPGGISLDESFALPANIQHIDVGRGQLVVVQ